MKVIEIIEELMNNPDEAEVSVKSKIHGIDFPIKAVETDDDGNVLIILE